MDIGQQEGQAVFSIGPRGTCKVMRVTLVQSLNLEHWVT